jgi:hypothetical protein
MKRLWSHKWIVVAGALVIVLCAGAVAWASTGPSQAPPPAASGQATLLAETGSPGTEASVAQAGPKLKQLKEKLKDRIADKLARQKAILKLVREKMTPEDQAKLDQLVANAKQQQDVLKQARQSLTQTLKDIRDLTNKYLPTTTTTAPSVPAAATPTTSAPTS